MPNQNWFNDDVTSRDRSRREHSARDWGRDERGHRDHDRDRGAFFGENRDRDRDRHQSERNRPIGGWGGLMGDEDRFRERGGNRDRDRWSSRDESAQPGDDRHFGPDDFNRDIPMDETERLIASNKVEGTPVYDRNGDRLGTIHNFMVDKIRGHVVYAVLKHSSGFLGLGERYYPLEWDQLTYDTRLGGYHVDATEEDLKSYGSFDSEGRWQSRGRHGRSDRDRNRERGRDRDRDYERGDRGMRGSW